MNALEKENVLKGGDADTLRRNTHIVTPQSADRMIENVIGVFGLPMGLGLNFLINDRVYTVPMVVEEPSIVAAVSSAAKIVRKSGGFKVTSQDPIGIGQIVVTDIQQPEDAIARVLDRESEILNLANSLHPKLVARGGGAVKIEGAVRPDIEAGKTFVVFHLFVDTRDAMGANLINSICESVSPLMETITGGSVLLRILSNLCDQSLVTAEAVIPADLLGSDNFGGEEVAERIVSAARFAQIDQHRAATHNKGIMNGIDAVAIATGNDWRSIEAGAHAHAAAGGQYSSLTRWRMDDSGNLCGRIELPMNVGIVGGSLESNPAVKLALGIVNASSSRQLAEIMASVGLAQNFAALRALVTDGIQKGHMMLHARSVAHTAGVDPAKADVVVERLIESGEIKVWKARQIMADFQDGKTNSPPALLRPKRYNTGSAAVSAAGKAILLGEHAVVYGRRALAVPLPISINARVVEDRPGIHLLVPKWGIDSHWNTNRPHPLSILKAIDRIMMQLGITRPKIRIELFPRIPRAAGLGSSAAAAVAVIRALSEFYGLGLAEDDVNRIAFESETIIHGKSSGLDNTVSCYEKPILYRAGNPANVSIIHTSEPIPLLIGLSGTESLTAPMVAKVNQAWRRDRAAVEAIFDRIDAGVDRAAKAIQNFDMEYLGAIMNANHEELSALNVSTPTLDKMVDVARQNGAIGAKMTGAGGGGSVVALCPEKMEQVQEAMHAKGWKTIMANIEPSYRHSNTGILADTQLRSEEQLMVVDENDNVIGTCNRSDCHAGDGIRHRAFSVFIFDSAGRLLIQKRSSEKLLWPMYWSNSCCSHPRSGESTSAAAHRRLQEELGIDTRLTYAFKFSYQARFGSVGSENEHCSVFIGQTDQPIQADPNEVSQWRYISPVELDEEMAEWPDRFTPWFKTEWERLKDHPLIQIYRAKYASTS